MSVGIYLREIDGGLWLSSLEPLTLAESAEDAMPFPNLVAAQEAFGRALGDSPIRMNAIARDPVNDPDGKILCECEALVPIEQTSLRGAVELFAMLKKSSKYFGQFRGWAKVDAVIAPSQGDHYCFRAAHNAYRHEDLIFGIKLPGSGETMRLDKWEAPKLERRAA